MMCDVLEYSLLHVNCLMASMESVARALRMVMRNGERHILPVMRKRPVDAVLVTNTTSAASADNFSCHAQLIALNCHLFHSVSIA